MATSKKKISQDELRRLMNEQKKKLLNNVKKIESPLARYEKDGTLHCIVCETVVRSEAVWNVHLNSKNHKQNILNKVKKKKEEQSKTSETPKVPNLKRLVPETPIPQISPKKIKGILKNSNSTAKVSEDSSDVASNILKVVKSDPIKDVNEDIKPGVWGKDDEQKQDPLPEGFFDDPKLDAKIRNVEYKDPVEEEWEQFQKEIREETNKAQQIISEDQEEATTERQIDEIDEQIRNWHRVVNLEKKKEKVNITVTSQKVEKDEDDNISDEEDFEEFLDWRSKKSFDYK